MNKEEQKIVLQAQEARNQILNDFNHNFLVEASAGSGKTSCLVKRMVALIKYGIYSVEQITAITFTRKAAIELKERFQQEIERELQLVYSSKEKNFLYQALINIEQCYIGTIHSFCARMLRERSLEGGLDPAFLEIDEIDNILFMEQAWEQYLSNLKIEDSSLFQNLEIFGVQIKDLKECYKKVCLYPEVQIGQEKVSSPELDSTMERLFLFCEEAEKYIPEQEPEKGYDSIQEAILQVQRLKKYYSYRQKDFYKVSLLEPFAKNYSSSGIIVLSRWLSKEKAREYRDVILPKLKEEYIEPALERWREYCYGYIFRFIKPAVDYYHQFREKQSLLNFQDLLLKTASLLRDNPEIRLYFQQKYRTILVDEFQDTDPIQAEIVFYLTGEQLTEKDWLKLVPGKGSLFIVGDPQQSIYHFRRADMSVYKQVKRLIIKNKGKVITLQTNFRSLHSIGNYINPLFQDLFSRSDTQLQVQYSPMLTIREDKKGYLSGVHQIVITREKEKKKTLENDAHSIASLIREWVDKKLKIVRTDEELQQGKKPELDFRDFLILLRYKSGIEIYSRILSEYGIPVTVSGYASLNESLYIRELLKLLRLLKDPENQVLLVAVLRGIFFGISDEELYQFKDAGGIFNFFSDLPEGLSRPLGQKIYHTFQQLRIYHSWCLNYSPVVVLEKIMIQSGLLPYCCGEIGAKEQGNELFFILEYLRESEMRNFYNYAGMVEQLERLWQSGVEEEFNLRSDENAVRIMNLHKAKGLESPVVFLAIAYNTHKPGPEYHIERFTNKPKGYFVVKKHHYFSNGKIIAQPQQWKEYCQIESLYQDAEETRLLYVAATRAKNLLIISSWGENYQDNNLNPWQSLLRNCKPEMILDVSVNNVPQPQGQKVSFSEEEYKQVKQKIEEEKKILIIPSYSESTASRLAEFSRTEAAFIPTVDKGGQEWGKAVHQVLEYIGKEELEDDLLQTYISFTLEKNNIEFYRKDELYHIIKKYINSDLYKRVKNALQNFVEVPFNLKIEPTDPVYQELITGEENISIDKKPIILTGTIDLVFQEADGWVIVDYKTDCPLNKDDYNQLKEIYQKQISIYSTIWQKITRERVKESLIYFVRQ